MRFRAKKQYISTKFYNSSKYTLRTKWYHISGTTFVQNFPAHGRLVSIGGFLDLRSFVVFVFASAAFAAFLRWNTSSISTLDFFIISSLRCCKCWPLSDSPSGLPLITGGNPDPQAITPADRLALFVGCCYEDVVGKILSCCMCSLMQ